MEEVRSEEPLVTGGQEQQTAEQQNAEELQGSPGEKEAEDQPEVGAEAAEEEPDIVKVDEGEAAAAAPAKPQEQEAGPKKKPKETVKFKVVLLEGKDLNLEEKVTSYVKCITMSS